MTVALVLALALNAAGFANVPPGQALPEKTLKRIGGKPQPYLTKSKVTVFFFFTPGTRNGQLALRKIAELEKEFDGKPVSWVALVSGSVPEADAKRDAADAHLAAPLLRDEGDELYGALGGKLTPVVGLADDQHRLLTYLPFHKLQYQDAIRAWTRFALGELDQAQLDVALKPPPLTSSGESDVGHRYLRLAQKLRERGELERALANTHKSLEHAPDAPAAHALLGAILAEQGKCADARPALEAALAGDPADELALTTKRACDEGTAGRRVTVDAGSTDAPPDAGDAGDAGALDGGADGGPDADADGGATDAGELDAGRADAASALDAGRARPLRTARTRGARPMDAGVDAGR